MSTSIRIRRCFLEHFTYALMKEFPKSLESKERLHKRREKEFNNIGVLSTIAILMASDVVL